MHDRGRVWQGMICVNDWLYIGAIISLRRLFPNAKYFVRTNGVHNCKVREGSREIREFGKRRGARTEPGYDARNVWLTWTCFNPSYCPTESRTHGRIEAVSAARTLCARRAVEQECGISAPESRSARRRDAHPALPPGQDGRRACFLSCPASITR